MDIDGISSSIIKAILGTLYNIVILFFALQIPALSGMWAMLEMLNVHDAVDILIQAPSINSLISMFVFLLATFALQAIFDVIYKQRESDLLSVKDGFIFYSMRIVSSLNAFAWGFILAWLASSFIITEAMISDYPAIIHDNMFYILLCSGYMLMRAVTYFTYFRKRFPE